MSNYISHSYPGLNKLNNYIINLDISAPLSSNIRYTVLLLTNVAQLPALIPKEVEIQRLKKIYIMVIMLGSIAASVEVDNFVDGSLHQT
ncbi:MAG TPA: hypothetical protein VF884_15690, partial [Nitrososphaeraceae archaeon]